MKRVCCAFVMLSLLLLSACRAVVPDYFAYRETDFYAEIVGELGGVAFSACVKAQTGDGGAIRSVEYLGEGNLAGLSVEAYPDGRAKLSRGDMLIECESDALTGLLSPIDALLVDSDLEAVKREGDSTVLTVGEGKRLTLDRDMIPVAFASSLLTFSVIRWECG